MATSKVESIITILITVETYLQVLAGYILIRYLYWLVFRTANYILLLSKFVEFVLCPRHNNDGNHTIPSLLKKNIKPRILSAPCARGEEPYSFAMLLLDSGFDLKNFSIFGIDISNTCVSKAYQGVYNKYSLRRVPNDFLNRHFTKAANDKYQINPLIKI